MLLQYFGKYTVTNSLSFMARVSGTVKYGDTAAERLLMAIAFQESQCEYRRQIRGPARGFWQFERGGGVHGVMLHHTTQDVARKICDALNIEFGVDTIYKAIEYNDTLACCFARLLLWSDPRPMAITEDEAWRYYIRTWRPGRPREDHWELSWRMANVQFPQR